MKTFRAIGICLAFFFLSSCGQDDSGLNLPLTPDGLDTRGFGADRSVDFRAGMASIDITPPVGVPLAGYGGTDRRIIPWDVFDKYEYCTYFEPSEGINDRLRGKALVLQDGDKDLVFISLDVVGAPSRLHRHVSERLKQLFGYEEDEIFISATHTHSGPGALDPNTLWELIASDKYHEGLYNQLLDDIEMLVTLAVMDMRPADLYRSSFNIDNLTSNRRVSQDPIDPQANMIYVKARSSGRWMGAIANFAIHPTSMGSGSQLISADNTGAIEAHLEAAISDLNGPATKQPTVLFINGNEGDISPRHKGLDGMEKTGQIFATKAMNAFPNKMPMSTNWSVTTNEIEIGRASLAIHACLDGTLRSLILRTLRLALGSFFPEETKIWLLRFGEIAIATWPGEPTVQVGNNVRQAIYDADPSVSDVWIFGMTNEHLAYFTTEEEFNAGGYEACSTLFGHEGGESLIQGYGDLAARSVVR